MSIGDAEIKTQERVIRFFKDPEILGYQYIGNLSDYQNKNINEDRLRQYLRLKGYADKLIDAAVMQLQQEAGNLSRGVYDANKTVYSRLKYGIPVSESPEKPPVTVELIDEANPLNNDFAVAEEVTVVEQQEKRPDLVIYLNGIAVAVIELKRSSISVSEGIRQNLTNQKDSFIRGFFTTMQFCMAGNESEGLRYGTLLTGEKFYMEWKDDGFKEHEEERDPVDVRISKTCEGIDNKLLKQIYAMFDKERFIDLIMNFVVFDKGIKKVCRYNQYFGIKRTQQRLNNLRTELHNPNRNQDKPLGGILWHTQGSGKSYSMVFFAKKVRRKMEGTPTFVILTDRDELNTQISDSFENCGLLGKNIKASKFMAASGDDLVKKLQGNPSFIFTLIQKFNQPDEEPIYPEHDIIIMSDEAHRSQYGIYADNMMKLLPTAARIGFTGTPLLSSDNITARTFGGYVSVYDFKRAVEDGATVPLYYENRGEKIEDLHNPEITEQILDAIEAADLDVDQQDKLEEEFAKEIHLLIAEPRLESIARDFVNHYSDLWTSGKAMFVCLNKVTCVRMYNYVQEYWAKEIEVLESKIKNASQQEAQELRRKLKWMQETEMAVVISQEQNEIQTFKEWHLDIKPHREKMEKRELDKEFKDSKNPLRIVFVCAMWLTGFDVKCLSCLYLDKPLKAHTLMQAIARANRVNEGKSNGLIIDYIGIVKALRKALADYTANVSGISGTDPTIDKKELISRITDTIGKAKIFLAEHDFDLESLIVAVGFAKLSYLQEAANAVCGTIENKKTYSTYASELNRLMKYIDRADITEHTRKQYEAIAAIYAELQKKRKHVNTTNLMIEINSIISSYIEIQHMPITSNQETRRFDISAIDFGLLRTEFAKVKRKNLVMRDLEEIIQQKLDRMLFTNPERINYYERYQQIIMGYNAEQDRATIEKTFMDLMDLANQMNQEEQRYAREGFSSDEELSLYDMLFRDDLSKNDIKKLKEVATTLLRKIKNRIAEIDHWTDKQETKAEIDNLIRNILYDELPLCYDEISISTYRQRIYEYVYTRYKSVA